MEEAINKAKELANKFYYVENPITDGNIRAMDWIDAIECAKICCNEILKNIEATKLYHEDSKALPFNENYWQEVKEALNI